MKKGKKGKGQSTAQLRELAALEDAAMNRGIHLHYDRLEASGLRLKSGLCTFNGEYHLYIEKRKSIAEKIEFLKAQLDKNLPNK